MSANNGHQRKKDTLHIKVLATLASIYILRVFLKPSYLCFVFRYLDIIDIGIFI